MWSPKIPNNSSTHHVLLPESLIGTEPHISHTPPSVHSHVSRHLTPNHHHPRITTTTSPKPRSHFIPEYTNLCSAADVSLHQKSDPPPQNRCHITTGSPTFFSLFLSLDLQTGLFCCWVKLWSLCLIFGARVLVQMRRGRKIKRVT
ncbi:hypothetical protein Hanom_Chr05g00435841 [Helianthus anomalus]